MSGRAVLFTLSHVLAILGLAMIAPLVVALITDSESPYETAEVVALGATSIGSIAIGLICRHLWRAHANKLGVREGFAVVTASWLLMATVGMIPFLATGVTDSVADAFFETMSGFTTTGATIFPEVEVIPHGLMFWRQMTQWLGGMGVVVLSVALLPFLGVGGYRLLKAETPGGMLYERDRPRITDSAKELWVLYMLLTAAQTLLLMVSGMDLYDAICHAFTTMSTGGFSPHTESIGYFKSPWIHWIIILFMFLAGANFSLHARAIRGDFRAFWKNPEFRLYTGLTVLAVLVCIPALAYDGVDERVVRKAAFQVISISTTTGYATDDYNLWPHTLRWLLFLLMFAGGCMGSTAGGVKSARILIWIKVVIRELHRLIFPHGVRPIRIGDRVVEPAAGANILAFGSIFIAAFILGSVVMAGYGYDLVSSMSASVAALSNVGPGLAAVGPAANWSHLPDFAKWVMSFLMMLGRLELFSVLVLFTSWAWRR